MRNINKFCVNCGKPIKINLFGIPKLCPCQPLKDNHMSKSKSTRARIMEWNRKRNGLKFDPILEARLLTEEANEYAMAETTAERLREYADFLFVATGTRCKFMAMRLQSADALVNVYARWQVLKQWIVETGESLREILNEEGVTESIIDEALRIIIEANEAKPITKDEHGKVIKGHDYVDPIVKIKALIGEV